MKNKQNNHCAHKHLIELQCFYVHLWNALKYFICQYVFVFAEVIDLSDEHGVVKNLRQNLDEYGYDYMKERETVILLRVDCEWNTFLELITLYFSFFFMFVTRKVLLSNVYVHFQFFLSYYWKKINFDH